MLDPLYDLIGWLLAFFYGLVPNLGVAIILLTCTVMLLLFPLTAKQARSMLAMQEIQPELKKIQAKHKGDRQKMVEEQQKLFQEHKVNPLGGCLPLVAQLPVFFALFTVLRDTYKRIPVDSDLFRAFCGDRGEAACGRDPGPEHLEFLSMDLSVTPLNAEGGFFTVAPYFVLVALIVLTGLFQSRQTQRTTPKGGANAQMLMIGRVLPIVFGVISLNFPAGLCVYFLVSNVWRLGQQEVIFRRIHLPHREQQAAKKSGGAKPPPTAIDVESRPAVEAPEVTPEEPAEAESPVPARTPAPSGGGRLRGLFGLPAAPNGEPAPTQPAPTQPAPTRPAPAAKPAKPASPSSAGRASSGGGGTRSNQARRKRNKKRKR